MGGIANSPVPEPLSAGKWITKIILAVIVGEAIWGFLVSLTNGVIVPGLARVMGGDPQSPVYLGKGDFNLTGIFVSILELCLAGIVAILLNQWSGSGQRRVQVKTVKVKSVPAKNTLPSIAPTSITPFPSVPKSEPVAPEPPVAVAAAAVPAQPASLSAPPAPVGASQPPPSPKLAPVAKPAAPARPEKPKKPQEIYYNIVGEPINPTEDDD
ncbi:MAG TPA: hypothetical protein VMB18_06620 [Terriglobales bacterium]|nr:hypothetical protein [Terriglobales bacterium]